MNRVLRLLPAVVLAAFTAACSGGGSAPTPPPPTGGFSNADLKGSYAFLMTGSDTNLEFLGRVGSFTADGNGNITSGIEDVNAANFVGTLPFTASSYSVQKDGRGTINLINSSGTLTFSITLVSPNEGYIVETDLNATTSGTFSLQNASAFTPTAVNGSYVFDVSGIAPDTNQNFLPDSLVGQFAASSGVFSSGVADENFSASLSGPMAITAGSTTFDSTNGPTTGRGELTFTAGGTMFSYVYYIVDATRIRMIETSGGVTLGDALAQTGAPANNAAFTGSFTFLVGGAGVLGSGGSVVRAARFTSDGNGNLTAVSLDDNDAGVFAQVPHGSLSSQTYAVDTTNGGGRVTLTFKDSSLGQYQFIAYMISPTQGVIQDMSAGIVADGPLSQQTGGPFTASSLAGNYAFNWSGISVNNQTTVAAEEDYVGQIVLDNSGNVSGATDFSEFSSNDGVFLNVVLSGNLAIGGDGTTSSGTRNTLTAKVNGNPSSTINFTAYVVSPGRIYVMGDSKNPTNRVIAGTLVKQSK